MSAANYGASLRVGIVGPGAPGHRVFESNFVMECSCGERENYATRDEVIARRWMAEHLRRHERFGPFDRLSVREKDERWPDITGSPIRMVESRDAAVDAGYRLIRQPYPELWDEGVE